MQTIAPKIGIVIADDHPLVLEGVRSSLETFEHIEILGTASIGRDLLELASRLQPDIAVLDINMPDLNGLEVTSELKTVMPEVKVLILSMHDDDEYVATAIEGGARGYVLKDVSTKEIVTAIDVIYGGGMCFCSGIVDRIASLPRTAMSRDDLTSREHSVLLLISDGLSNREVARELDISVRTAETHRKNIKKKLGIVSTAGLTRYVIENKLR